MGATEAVRPAWRRRRIDVRRLFTHDFPMKAVAILIAMVFAISNAQSSAPRIVVVAFDGRPPVERPEVPAGYVLRGPLGDVAVTLRGPESAVSQVTLADLRATLDIRSLALGQPELQSAPVSVTVARERVEVTSVFPATIAVRLERLVSRTISVQPRFVNEPPAGSRAGDAVIAPTEVTVTGPESAVAQIAAVYGTVAFGGAMTDITQPSTPAIATDAAGAPIDGVQVEPAVVAISVPVLPTATTRTVPVVFTLRGAAAPGFWVTSVVVDPLAVTVRGDESVLSKLDRLETQSIDVGGLNATRSLVVPLVLPEGVTMLRPTDVTVQLTVQPLAGARTFTPVVQVTGLAANQIAELDFPSVTLVLAGPMPTLIALGPDQVGASVDVGGRGSGTFSIDLTLRIPAGVTVQSLQPGRVTVTVRSR